MRLILLTEKRHRQNLSEIGRKWQPKGSIFWEQKRVLGPSRKKKLSSPLLKRRLRKISLSMVPESFWFFPLSKLSSFEWSSRGLQCLPKWQAGDEVILKEFKQSLSKGQETLSSKMAGRKNTQIKLIKGYNLNVYSPRSFEECITAISSVASENHKYMHHLYNDVTSRRQNCLFWVTILWETCKSTRLFSSLNFKGSLLISIYQILVFGPPSIPFWPHCSVPLDQNGWILPLIWILFPFLLLRPLKRQMSRHLSHRSTWYRTKRESNSTQQMLFFFLVTQRFQR